MSSLQWVARQRSPVHQKLMANSGATLQITSAGFQFLLHPPHEQLWELLLQYLQMAEVTPFLTDRSRYVQRIVSLGTTNGPRRDPQFSVDVVHDRVG